MSDTPLADTDIAALDALLASVPAPLEPLDAAMADGFLCAVLVQPRPVPVTRWLPHITDAGGRALPRGFDATQLHALLLRRHAELDSAIRARRWFDPWIFDATGAGQDVAAVEPWVAGFAAAMEWFPALLDSDHPALTQPLALVFRHFDADELEDADALLEEIESLEPPADLSAAVEELVRATLLLADVAEKTKLKSPAGRHRSPSA